MKLIHIRPKIYLLDESGDFPDPNEQDFGDLVAVGGELSPDRILKAFRLGAFAWYIERGAPHWYSPRIRMILEPSRFHISKSLARTIKSGRYEIRRDYAFKNVMLSCAKIERKREMGTWIKQAFIDAYCELHKLGFARSVESYKDGELVGGLYGIQIGRVFSGESMFAFAPDSSKTALAHLCSVQPFGAVDMIDCQTPSDHLASLGGVNISRKEYLARLKEALLC
ncbi:MAG: leucyl/phenylalanyl-tRNA--protein transferase [Helicobacteraceae bacterium]|nr:leucyl/phenylalanyl-tRNA--protein transferase [Helicobacteraceae bacterium]